MKKRMGSVTTSTHHLFVAHPYLQHYAVSVCGTNIRRSETTTVDDHTLYSTVH
jgi:hypothetical protein